MEPHKVPRIEKLENKIVLPLAIVVNVFSGEDEDGEASHQEDLEEKAEKGRGRAREVKRKARKDPEVEAVEEVAVTAATARGT